MALLSGIEGGHQPILGPPSRLESLPQGRPSHLSTLLHFLHPGFSLGLLPSLRPQLLLSSDLKLPGSLPPDQTPIPSRPCSNPFFEAPHPTQAEQIAPGPPPVICFVHFPEAGLMGFLCGPSCSISGATLPKSSSGVCDPGLLTPQHRESVPNDLSPAAEGEAGGSGQKARVIHISPSLMADCWRAQGEVRISQHFQSAHSGASDFSACSQPTLKLHKSQVLSSPTLDKGCPERPFFFFFSFSRQNFSV